jgi:FMN-dependent NADH-azoreductase
LLEEIAKHCNIDFYFCTKYKKIKMSAFVLPNILVINSSVRTTGSISRKLTGDVVDHFLRRHDGANVEYIDVGQIPFPYINDSWVTANLTPPDKRTPGQVEKLRTSDTLIAQLKKADIIVIGSPMYNFTVPATLKNYVDLICRAGHTFNYTETGPVGLLKGKRAVICVSSAGVPIGSPMDFVSGWLSQICGFIGIEDRSIISLSEIDDIKKL